MMFAELAARQSANTGENSNGAQKPLNPFAVGQPVLQKKTVEKEFTEHNITEYLIQSNINATSRLRLLDSIRLHSPLESECKKLNVPNSRLNVLVLKDILYLCGGLVGARFSSEELTGAKAIVQQLTSLWYSVELSYKELSAADKKVLWTTEVTGTTTVIPEQVAKFFDLSNKFLEQLLQLQSLVKRVQDSIDPEEAAKFDNTDPESKIGKKFPDFLTTLLAKYNGGPLPENSKPANFTIGKFSVYLSEFMTNSRGFMTPQESEALSLLLQASNDVQNNFTNHQMETNSVTKGFPSFNQKYWAQRFYNFLSSMTELQSIPKDEKYLLNLS